MKKIMSDGKEQELQNSFEDKKKEKIYPCGTTVTQTNEGLVIRPGLGCIIVIIRE